MAKIVIVSSVFPPEPLVSARLSADIAFELSKTEDVVVLCPSPTRPVGSHYSYTQRVLPYMVVTLPSFTCPKSKILGRLKESYSFGLYVSKYISTHRNEIKCIYANTHPTFGQYLLLHEAKKYGIPCIIHIQDIYPESLTVKLGFLGIITNKVLVKYDSLMMKKATALIAISESMRNHLIESRNYPSTKIKVVYNWQDDSIFNNYEQTANEKTTFMFVGSLSPSADLPNIIKAFCNANLLDSKLILAGNGSDKEQCIKTAKMYPYSDIEFLPVSPETVPIIQSKADILILPLKKGISKTALPSKLPAYLFSGKPIIACCEEDSDIANLIRSVNCGWIVPPEDYNALTKQFITSKFTDLQSLINMGKRGRMLGMEKLSKKANLYKIINIIKSVSNGSTRNFQE